MISLDIIIKSKRIRYIFLIGFTISGSILSFLSIFAKNSIIIPWNNYIFIVTIICSCLLLSSLIVDYYFSKREKIRLKLILNECASWWNLTNQKNGDFITHISIQVSINNISDKPIGILKARLIKPKTKCDILDNRLILPKEGSRYYSTENKISPHDTVTGSLNMIISKKFLSKSKNLKVTVGITDQFGTEYQLKGVISRLGTTA